MPVWTFQEEEALLSEMDVTGQAFEDMQEQNSRLMQQLREKDDANFKLMSERIKSNQIYKLLREEKEELADQVLTFKTQVCKKKSISSYNHHVSRQEFTDGQKQTCSHNLLVGGFYEKLVYCGCVQKLRTLTVFGQASEAF